MIIKETPKDQETLDLIKTIVQQHSLIIESNTDILVILNHPMVTINIDSKVDDL